MTATTIDPVEQVRERTTGLQTRDLIPRTEVRATGTPDTKDWGVRGMAVPWDDPIEYWGIREEFAPGSVQVDEDNTPQLFWRHQEIIGGLRSWKDTEKGWDIDAAISDTTLGRDAHTLAKDGHVRKFSIGFLPIEWEERHDEESGTITLRYTRALVREVSLVPHPAYGNASVDQVRSADRSTPIVTSVREAQPNKEDTMSADTLTRADLDEVRTAVEDLDRRMADLPLTTEETDPAEQYRSVGHLLKSIVGGDEMAVRAYEGATTEDAVLKAAWIGSLVEIIKKRRPVMSTFSSGSLPATGLSVEYAVLEEDTTDVDIQENEADVLAFGKVSIGTRTAPVVTMGGWTSLTRQAIERANEGILTTTMEALVEKYGQASEAYARKALTDALAVSGDGELATVEADLTTQDGVVAGVLDLAEHFDNAGRALDGVFVDKATFLALYGVEANDRILQVAGAPQDKVGTITVQTAHGNVAGLEFKLLPNADADTVVAYDRTALKTLEAPGAPFRLSDEDITNLTKAFSVYGYLAAFMQKPAGLVKVTAAAG